MTMSTDARIDGVDATVGIVDGRVAMSADVTSTLVVQTPDETPLSSREPHATLAVADDDVRATIELDADTLAELAAVVGQQEGGR